MPARVNQRRTFRLARPVVQILIMGLPQRGLRYLLIGGLVMVLTACQIRSTPPAPSSTQRTPTTLTPTVTVTGANHTQSQSPTSTAALVNEGKQIFTTGLGPDGRPIPRTATTVGGMMGGGMMGSAGCASCHGPQGRGERIPAFTAPNVTYSNLTDQQGMHEMDGSRGPTYTDAQIKQAVTLGIGADGDKLDTTMPRWRMSDQEFSALLAYLKTLP